MQPPVQMSALMHGAGSSASYFGVTDGKADPDLRKWSYPAKLLLDLLDSTRHSPA